MTLLFARALRRTEGGPLVTAGLGRRLLAHRGFVAGSVLAALLAVLEY